MMTSVLPVWMTSAWCWASLSFAGELLTVYCDTQTHTQILEVTWRLLDGGSFCAWLQLLQIRSSCTEQGGGYSRGGCYGVDRIIGRAIHYTKGDRDLPK